ncbi:MAG: DNA methyltransferase [Polyangiaceae bacterium]
MASIARHHAEWLSLVEVSGPFLSMPVLLRAFPQGLDAHDAPTFRDLRSAYEEWLDDQRASRPDPAIHNAWIDFVLRAVLGFEDDALARGQRIPETLAVHVREHGITLRADLAVVTPADLPNPGAPRMLVQVYPPDVGLERALRGTDNAWAATPATRMMELLHGTGVRVGLVTNGEHWMLVDAPRGQTTGFVSWYAQYWLEEKVTLQAFRSLLSAQRFFGVDARDQLEALLAESASDQQEVTDQLGYQVRRAVEVLVQAIDRIDRERKGALLAGVAEKQLYEAALTVMMRLVFLLSAEEQGRLFANSVTWREHYGVATLRDQLREAADRHGEEVLERRHDAWARLLATFRAVHGGVTHEAMRSPAYGGGLFDPDRHPFLEGRAAKTQWKTATADPLPIHNRTVLHLLDALQVLQVKVPGGGPAEARRLSFRAIGVEQIGHVYEGLLDHTAVRATEPVLGLKGPRDSEPEVPLSTLERLKAKSPEELVAWLKDETRRSEKALQKETAYTIPDKDRRWSVVCERDEGLYRRVAPFAGLVRDDTVGLPIVIHPGSVYVTQGSERRSTGTHYTPPSLTEPIVRHTLDPLVYVGPAEGTPREQWKLRTPDELLALKVCDMAMGSGAFLVQACRYLAERLVEAWSERATHGVTTAPVGEPSKGIPTERLLPDGLDERLALARRLVADRCLYGVDKNPMAVEMAKLSLWLVTFERERPFTFLDHALRSGDSLLGLTDPEQVKWFHLDPARGRALHTQADTAMAVQGLFNFAEQFGPVFETAAALREELERLPENDITDTEDKARLLRQAEALSEQLRLVADVVVATAMETASKGPQQFDDRLKLQMLNLSPLLDRRVPWSDRYPLMKPLAAMADQMLQRGRPAGADARRPFHWVIEFPEVFATERRGFDAIVGNPPFMGGQKITGALGTDYRDALVEHLAKGRRGSADYCAYFFLRAVEILHDRGGFGLIATNTIAQGDTREVGLDAIVASGCSIVRAVPSMKWPGVANLEVSCAWARRRDWSGPRLLGERAVRAITPMLTEAGAVEGKPYRLKANEGKSFQGSIVLGMGFVLEPEEAGALIAKDPRNREVVMPYLNGEDLNSRWDQSASRWVINFRDWPLEKAESYPDCMAIVREKVKPERERNTFSKHAREEWWQFERVRAELYDAIAVIGCVLMKALTSKHHAVERSFLKLVIDQTNLVFAVRGYSALAMIQWTGHECWALHLGASLELRPRYTLATCFETYPFPASPDGLESIGERYHTHRASIMAARKEGLTKTYNRFHTPSERAADITQLRALHVEMDRAVADAYGWSDLALEHGFHETKQGTRYTISEKARREVLARLLKLNHERYAKEVAAGLHDKGKKAKGAKASAPVAEPQDAEETGEEVVAAAPVKRGRGRPKKSEAGGGEGQGSLF